MARSAWVELPLSLDQTRRKLAAIRMYRSQLPNLDRLLLEFARANELFAPLPVRAATGADTLVWVDENSGRRNLRGAEITELVLEIRRDLEIRAQLTRTPKKLGRGAYVSLDLRSWDAAGRPLIANVTIARGSDPKGMSVEGEAIRVLPVAVRDLGAGRVTINGLSVPGGARPRPALFVTCWGSVRDKVTDPAVVVRVASAPPAPLALRNFGQAAAPALCSLDGAGSAAPVPHQ